MSEIDREKLVAWSRERLNQLKKNRDVRITRDYVDGYIDAFEEWLYEIQSGTFDTKPLKQLVGREEQNHVQIYRYQK